MSYTNPYTLNTNSLLPKYENLKEIFKKADEEDDRARDIRPLMKTLTDLISINPRLSGLINTRTTSVAAMDWQITNNGEPDLELTALFRKVIQDVIHSHVNTVLYGDNLYKLKWSPYGNGVKYQLPNVEYCYEPYEIERLANNEIAVVSDSNLKTTVQDDFNYLRDSLKDNKAGVLRTILPQSLILNEMINEWGNLNKRLKGIIIGSIDGEGFQRETEKLQMPISEVQKLSKDLENSLKNAGDSQYLKTLKSVEIKLSQIADASAGTSYQSLIEEINNNIAIAILGQANTAQLPNNGGSRAALQVLNLVRADIHYTDVNRVKNLIDKLLLKFYQQNYNRSDVVSPYIFEWLYLDTVDTEANSRIFEAVCRAGVKLDLKKKEVYAMLGYSVPVEGDDVITVGENTSGLMNL